MASMLQSDTPAKCCSYCGGRDHNYEDCPKRKTDGERQKEGRDEPGTQPLKSKPPFWREGL